MLKASWAQYILGQNGQFFLIYVNMYNFLVQTMAIRVVEFSNGGHKVRKIFA